MSKILAYSLPHAGHLFPAISVLLELRKRGYEAVLASPAESIAGLPPEIRTVRTSAAVLGRGVPGPGGDPGAVMESRAELFARRGRGGLVDLEHAIRDERPDLLLVDPAVWGALICASASGLPWASLAYSCVYIPAMGARLVGPGLPPPANPIECFVQADLADRITRSFDAQQLERINALCAARGVRPLHHAHHLYRMPPLVLAFTAEPFEYPRADWHPSVRFVGPNQWEPPTAPGTAARFDGDGPVVVVTGPTVTDSARATSWIPAALEALSEEEVEVIAAVPTGPLPPQVPPNASVHRFIPLRGVLPRAECLLSHGGTGVTQLALSSGVPVVAIPSGYDRLEVARRVDVAGAGVALLLDSPRPAEIRDAVHAAKACKAGASRVAEAFRRTGGVAAAADALEPMLTRN
jgi:MGT family glycosyltransferase